MLLKSAIYIYIRITKLLSEKKQLIELCVNDEMG